MGGRGGSSTIERSSTRDKYTPIDKDKYRNISVNAVEIGPDGEKKMVLTEPMTERQVRKKVNEEFEGRPNNGLVNDLVTGRYAYYERFGNKYTLIFGDHGKGSKRQRAKEFYGDTELTNQKEVKEKMVEYMMTGKTKGYSTTRKR